MSSMNELIDAYKVARDTINKNKDDINIKKTYVNDFIDLVNKYYDFNNDTSTTPTTTNSKTELSKMLKNPLEIAIYNNFQRYADDDKNNTDNIINPIIAMQPDITNSPISKRDGEDYFKRLRKLTQTSS